MNAWSITSLLGLIIMLGSVGAAELGNIDIPQLLIQGFVGLGLMLTGLRGYLIHTEQEAKRYHDHDNNR